MTTAISAFEQVGGWATVIAAVFFIISCLLAYLLFRRAKPTKTIDWEPVGLASIVKAPVSQVSTGLKLTWNDQVLRTPFSVKLRIRNTGTTAVATADFIKPPTFDYGSARCYEVRVSAVSNPDVMPLSELTSTEVPGSKFSLESPALNAGEWFELTMIADGATAYPTVNTRVFGETREMSNYLSLRTKGPRSRALVALSSFGILLAVASIVCNILLGGNTSSNHYQGLLAAGIILGVFLAFGSFIARALLSVRLNAASWDQLNRPPEI